MIRIEAGPYRAITSTGRTLHVDQPISERQADLIAELIDRAGLTEDITYAVEMTEGSIVVEHDATDENGGRRVQIVDGQWVRKRTELRMTRNG